MTTTTQTVYEIIENGFSYKYRADGYQDAIDQWVRATFVDGCTGSEPDNFGAFFVSCPATDRFPAKSVKAVVSRESK